MIRGSCFVASCKPIIIPLIWLSFYCFQMDSRSMLKSTCNTLICKIPFADFLRMTALLTQINYSLTQIIFYLTQINVHLTTALFAPSAVIRPKSSLFSTPLYSSKSLFSYPRCYRKRGFLAEKQHRKCVVCCFPISLRSVSKHQTYANRQRMTKCLHILRMIIFKPAVTHIIINKEWDACELTNVVPQTNVYVRFLDAEHATANARICQQSTTDVPIFEMELWSITCISIAEQTVGTPSKGFPHTRGHHRKRAMSRTVIVVKSQTEANGKRRIHVIPLRQLERISC